MEFTLSDEQILFQESVASFVAKEYDADKRCALTQSEDGFSRAHWAHFAELGWLSLAIDEADGGLGGTALDTAVLMEGFGRGLLLEPYLSNMVMGAGVIGLAASEGQKSAVLPALGGGELLLSFAFAEPRARYDLAMVASEAVKGDGGYVLNGHKSVVLHAASADKIIVSARTAGKVNDANGISLFLLERAAPGLSLQAYATIDGGRAAEVMLADAKGELAIADPMLAAEQFVSMTKGMGDLERRFGKVPSIEATEKRITCAVDAFLRAYAPA